MNEDEFLVDFDEDKDVVVINDKIKTKGAISYSISKEKTKNEYDLDVDTIVIKGILATPYYTQDIEKLETARYILNQIEVTKEEFGSKEDTVVYHFEAQFARVKYQTIDYKEI